MGNSSYSVNEHDGSIEVCAIVISGTLGKAVNFTMMTVDNSATSSDPHDFTALSAKLLQFNETVSTICVDISINDDNRVEYPENFTVGISSYDQDVDYMTQNSIVTIIDNDMAWIGFEMAEYRREEGEMVEVCAMVSNSTLERSVLVNISTEDVSTEGLTVATHIPIAKQNLFAQQLQVPKIQYNIYLGLLSASPVATLGFFLFQLAY